MHEAFAAQVLSNLRGFESQAWAERAGLSQPVGEVDRSRLNVMGGSISIGHPFGATGARITTTLAERAAPSGRAVRTDDGLRSGRDGIRDGVGERVVTPALTTVMRDGGIAVVTFDLPGETVNKLTRGAVAEFIALMDRVDSDPSIRAVVLVSGKPDLFIAGADIEGFLELRTAAEAEALSREGQELMNRLEKLRAPVVCCDSRVVRGRRARVGARGVVPHRDGSPEDGTRASRSAVGADTGRGRHAAAAAARRAPPLARNDPAGEERTREEGAADRADR